MKIIIDPVGFFDIEPIYICENDIDLHNNYSCIKFYYEKNIKKMIFNFSKSDFGIKNGKQLPDRLDLFFKDCEVFELNYESNLEVPYMTIDIFQRVRVMYNEKLCEIVDDKKAYMLNFINDFSVGLIAKEVYIEYTE